MAFVDVCKKSYLYEGEMVPCKVGDQEIVIMWPERGLPRAFDAVCPHEQVSLAKGVFSGRTLTCIAHGWVFDGHTGEGLSPRGCELTEYPLQVTDLMVQIDLDDPL